MADYQIELRPEKRRSDEIAHGTFACPHCDAPVSPGRSLKLTARATCPFCAHTAPARDFLSLALPTRPAHVVVKVRGPALSVARGPRARR